MTPGTFVAIGAVQVSGGYDIAWKMVGSSIYTIWSLDSSGNFVANIGNDLAGNSSTLQSFETTFQQDLNGDGTIGPPGASSPPTSSPPTGGTLIHTNGSTSLMQVGNDYFLDPVGGGTGPEVQQGGAPVTPGTFVAIGAVQVSGGYDIAWKMVSSSVYTIWSLDSSGNFVANIGNDLAGNSSTLQSFETTFQQDLNGDGTIGPPGASSPPTSSPPTGGTLIHTNGSTSLMQVGNDYFLDPVGGGTGPEVQQGGAPVTPGTFVAIGAVQVSGGYDIAWKMVGSSIYTIWSLDSSGNFVANIGNDLAGNSSTLQSFETTFQQDLNGDGVTGINAVAGTTLQITNSHTNPGAAATIGAGATLELGVANSASVTFSSSTGMLKLDNLTAFTGVIHNFTGDGTLAGSDQIDLKGINFGAVSDSYSNGVLTVTDGTHTTTLDFSGSYTLANFKFANDGSGGTIVYDPPAPGQPQTLGANNQNSSHWTPFGNAGHDSFVFAPTPGQDNAAAQLTDATHPSSVNMAAFSGTHDGLHSYGLDSHDSASAHPAQHLVHLNDFHII